jgi:ABC-type amino acid transport substrate-binding protein
MKQVTFLLTLILLISGCVKTGPQSSLDADKSIKFLRVGISTNSPPIAYKENNKIVGLEVDLAKGLADFTGRQLKLIRLNWKDQIPSLLDKKTDIIMSGMSITEARRYRISFTDPYMVSGQISLIRRVDRGKFLVGMTDLLSPAVRLGTVTGTTGDFLIQEIKAKGARTQFPTSAKAVKALLAGKLDAFVYDLPGILYLASMYTDEGLIPVTIPLTREYLAWGVRPDDQELLNSANSYLKSISDQAILTETIQRWIPYYKP